MVRTVLLMLIFIVVVPPTAAKPNLLVIIADDMRPDCIAALGNDRIRTPNLDRLVAEGVSFTRAVSAYPICVVSRAEMLSGQPGWVNGVTGLNGGSFRDGIVYWGEAFRDAGYQTWHVGKWHVPGRPTALGYTDTARMFGSGGGQWWEEGQTDWKGFPITGYRGWIFQSGDGREKYPELGVGVQPDTSEKIADGAVSLIKRDPDEPWFCHVNFTAPHDPLFLPPGFEEAYRAEDMVLPENFLPVHPFDHGNFDGRDEALLAWPRTGEAVRDLLRVYYAVIEDMDHQVGRILEALDETGERDNTVIVFTSDHGMACGSHGLRGKQNLYEHTWNVPFIVSGPEIEKGLKTEAQIYLRDLYPTTCELAGIPVPDTVEAESFAPILRGERDEGHEFIYGYFTDTQRGVRSADGWKYIVYPRIGREQLFDLNRDPFELEDLSGSTNAEHRERFHGLQDRVEKWRRVTGDPLLVESD